MMNLSNTQCKLIYEKINKRGKESFSLPFPLAVTVYPGIRYRLKGHFEELYFCYSAETIPEIQRFLISGQEKGWHFEASKTIYEIIGRTFHLLENLDEKGSVEQLDRYAEMLISETIINSDSNFQDKWNEKGVRRIASYLNAHYQEGVDLDKLIRTNGLSRRSFYRHWKEIFSVTPYQYILRLKSEEAKHLLETSDMKIHEIADHLNFNDPFHFSKQFKAYTGLRPSRYRSMMRSGSGI